MGKSVKRDTEQNSSDVLLFSFCKTSSGTPESRVGEESERDSSDTTEVVLYGTQ